MGLTNQLMAVQTGTSGVDWAQAATVGEALLLSPLVGFVCAGLLLLARKLPDESDSIERAFHGYHYREGRR